MKIISILFWLWITTSNQCDKTLASRAKLVVDKVNGSQCHLIPVKQELNDNQCANLESILPLKTAEIHSESENHTHLSTGNLPNPIKKNLEFTSKHGMNDISKIVHPLNRYIHWPLLLVLVCLISYGKMTLTKEARMINTFSGPPIIPFFGCVLSAIGPFEDMAEFFSQSLKRYGSYARVWIFHRPCIMISDADGAQAVLGGRDDAYRSLVAPEFKWAFSPGLFSAEGETWRHDRKLLEPYFKYQRVHRFIDVFNKHSKVLVQSLNNRVELEKGSLDLRPILSLCTMDLITESTLGEPTSFQTNPTHGFIRATHQMNESLRTRMLKPYMSLPIIWHVLGSSQKEADCKKYFKDNLIPIIDARRKKREIFEQASSNFAFFVDALLDAGKTDEEIIGQIISIFFAGSDTTSSGMNYTLFLLALNKNCQEKVRKELKIIFGEDGNRDVTLNDLAGMKYLEMCIKESLRLFPPAPAEERSPSKNIKLKNGLVIPGGCSVLVYAFEMHRDPKHFPDPEKFLPERFLPKECVKRHPFAYAPFSAGARNCIGQKYAMLQMKTILAYILRNFAVSTESSREKLKVIPGMILEPAGGGINLKLTKIK